MNIRAAWPVLICSTIAFAQRQQAQPTRPEPPIHARPAAVPPAAPPVVTDEAGILSTRPVWPVNVPLYVKVNRLPISDARAHDVTLHADIASAPAIQEHVYGLPVGCILPGPGHTWDDMTRLAGTPREPADGVAFSVAVSDPEGKDPKAAEKPKRLKLPVQVKGTVDEILTATPLPDLDAALPKELSARFYRRGWNSRGSPRLWLGTYTNCNGKEGTSYPGICHVLAKHPEVTFAIHVEVVHDGKAVASASGWWRGDAKYVSVNPFEGMLSVDILDESFDQLDRKDGKWRLHITPAPDVALRDFGSSRYWHGDVKTPVNVTDSQNWDDLVASGEAKKP
jgi:hypothetical protein